mgnify:FL=1
MTQTYSEYDFEFEKLLQSVEEAVTCDNNEQEDSLVIISSRTKRLSGKRSSVRKSILLGGTIVQHEAKKPSRGRSLYIMPSGEGGGGGTESAMDKEIRLAQEVAMQTQRAEAKSSYQSQSAVMSSQKAARRTSRAQSEGGDGSGAKLFESDRK